MNWLRRPARSIERLVILSDTHVGSTVGLWPGAHAIEGGGEYSANEYQRWLLKCWQEMISEIASFEHKPTIVMNGDPVQGTSYRDGQLITNKTDIQQRAAEEMFKPLRALAARWFQVRGTEWHEGKAAEHVELLAKALDAERDPSSGQWTWWELYLALGKGGPVVQIAHHVGVSSVPWYEATVPLRDTLMLLAELWRFYGERAPNVRMVVRSHRHRFIYVNAPPDIHVVVTPAWQLKTAFAHRRASAMLPQIGYVVIEWDGADLMVKPRLFELPDLHVEVL